MKSSEALDPFGLRLSPPPPLVSSIRLQVFSKAARTAMAMATARNAHFFPLTSLQIGDLQSYLSCLTLFLTPESKKLFILVDNRPWLIGQDTRPAHLWQLMVTKSRLSPFANTRARREKRNVGKGLDFTNNSRSNTVRENRLYKWFSVIDAALFEKKVLLPVKKLKDSFVLNKELHCTLFGFIVFEVAWAHVRGINYLNELQTDTSVALEAKLMKRWEFDSIEQASSCISLWYSGTFYERFLLQEYLDSVSSKGDVFYDAQEVISQISPIGAGDVHDNDFYWNNIFSDASSNFVCSPEVEQEVNSPDMVPPTSGPYKRRKIMKSSAEWDEDSDGTYSEILSSPRLSVCSSSSSNQDNDNARLVFEASNYRDALILFRFDDHDLPFKLRDIIMSDLRLLTLLEYGLPSWVIFLQSYPLFCQIYRPWMCPLARALYVLISMVTVLIGFYDLYKNVPLLKATASRLFGPFFDWIETWEMISRIKYLGTMLFLHNFEKAVTWLLMVTRAARSLLLVLTKPIAGPIVELVELILPFWNICLDSVEWLGSVIWIVLGSSFSMVVGTFQVILWPFWLVCSVLWNIATLIIYPILWVFCEILVAPFRLVLAMASFIAVLFSNAYYMLRDSWSSVSIIFQFASATKTSAGASQASMWRSLWNDLFSQVFRALRSILYGFVAFFTTCNRHRLSIYNHLLELLTRFSYVTRRSGHSVSQHDWQKQMAQRPSEASRRPKDKHILQSEEKLHRPRHILQSEKLQRPQSKKC